MKEMTMEEWYLHTIEADLILKYGFEPTQAHELVYDSWFWELFNEVRDYVLHYSPKYWAYDIAKCENEKPHSDS